MRGLSIVMRYGLSNALLLAFIAALAHGGWPIWAVIVIAALTGGVIDETVGDGGGQIGGRGQVFVEANLYATLPLLVIMTYWLLGLVVSGQAGQCAGAPALVGAVIGAGYFHALAGVTVAHELTHRVANPLALVWARVLLAFTLNPTFESYHVLGHHRNVCTNDDPATAWRGEYVLAYVARTLVYQSIDGWRLEAERLHRKELGVWSLHNRVLGGIGWSLAISAASALIAGAAGLVAFLAAAAFGRILHEMMNYVQHYGLVRVEGAPIEMRHAWDSGRLVSNALFYNLPRHADHHRFAAKPFWALELPAESPKFPYGYHTMSMISLIPAWWHRTIDPLLADWDRRLANDVERSLVRERGWAPGGAGAGAGKDTAEPKCRAVAVQLPRSAGVLLEFVPQGSLCDHAGWKVSMSDETVVADRPSVRGAARFRQDSDHSRQIDWYYASGVVGFHLLALLAFLPWFFSWTGVLLVPLGMYVFGTLGICVGFHRLLTHRSFTCPRWLERTFALLGSCCVMESPAYWVAIHRRHHQFADDEHDPHSPLRSFFWAHVGWYMLRVDPARRAELLQRYAKDLMRDPLYAFLERNHNWVALVVISWLAFFGLGWGAALAMGASTADAIQFGASVLVWGVFVRSVEVFQATMCVNSITHLWGYRNYETHDNSKNNFYVAMITTGEGWHNNHHADPRSARHGHAWWELDITWLTIRLLERVGLAWDVARPSPHLAAMKGGQDLR